jgi:hypothetical protein
VYGAVTTRGWPGHSNPPLEPRIVVPSLERAVARKPSDFLPITFSLPVAGSTVTAYAVSWPPNSVSSRVPSGLTSQRFSFGPSCLRAGFCQRS